MDRSDVKLGFTLAYLAAVALHLALAWAIHQRRSRVLEIQIFTMANVALATWHVLQLFEFFQHAEVLRYSDVVNSWLAGGQLVLGLLVLLLFFHLFATFERVYRRKAPSLRAALTNHVHRRQSVYIPAGYALLVVGGLAYLLDAGGLSQFVNWWRGQVGPASAYLFGGTLLFMTFVLFPAREGQEKILVPSLGRALLMISLGVSVGCVALWHESHPTRTTMVVLPFLHLHSVAFCVFLALVRYEFSFMDRYVLSTLRVGTWGVVVLIAYFIYNRLADLVDPFGYEALSVSRVSVLLAAVGASPYLGGRVVAWSEKNIFGRNEDLDDAVHRFAARLAQSKRVQQVVDSAGQDIASALHAKKVHIVVGSSRQTKEAFDRETKSGFRYRLRVPLGSQNPPPGWILLGERRNLYPYFDGERRYLALVGDLLGGTIEVLRTVESERRTPSTPAAASDELDATRDRLATAQSELRRVRAELDDLNERFDPELLGEVLTISDELADRNPEMALNVVRRLHSAYHYLLAPAERLTTLGQEMAFAQDYLALEKLRLRNRLEVRLSYDSALQTQAVPRRLLQPIIENSLRHGLARELRSGSIAIHAREDRGDCEVIIVDNGAGFPVGFELGSEQGRGGLARVRRWLGELYGEAAELSVGSVDGEGARVVLRFPRRDMGSARHRVASA